MPDHDRVLHRAADLASGYLTSLETRPVGTAVDLGALRAAMGAGTRLPKAPPIP